MATVIREEWLEAISNPVRRAIARIILVMLFKDKEVMKEGKAISSKELYGKCEKSLQEFSRAETEAKRSLLFTWAFLELAAIGIIYFNVEGSILVSEEYRKNPDPPPKS